MKAMILAAGKGTRLKPITDLIPKPMIPLIRKPVMECLIDHLKRYGVTDIVVNTSYLPFAIEDYFRDGERFGVHMAYSFEGKLDNGELVGQALGSAGGLKRIQDFSGFFDDAFIVVCGDALIDLDVAAVVDFHRKKGAIATIVLKEVPTSEVDRYGIVELAPDGRIVRFQEKPRLEEAVSNHANTGIYVFDPKVFNYIPSGSEYDIGGQLFPALADAGLPFYGVALPFQWLDIGTIADYWDATRKLLRGEVKGFALPGREVRPGIHTGIHLSVDWDTVKIVPPVYIGSSTRIEPGVEIIGPTMIGANCQIETGAVVRECLIHDYTRVGGVTHLEQKIVTGTHCIDPAGYSLDIQDSGISWLIGDSRSEVALDPWQRQIYMMASVGGGGDLP